MKNHVMMMTIQAPEDDPDIGKILETLLTFVRETQAILEPEGYRVIGFTFTEDTTEGYLSIPEFDRATDEENTPGFWSSEDVRNHGVKDPE